MHAEFAKKRGYYLAVAMLVLGAGGEKKKKVKKVVRSIKEDMKDGARAVVRLVRYSEIQNPK